MLPSNINYNTRNGYRKYVNNLKRQQMTAPLIKPVFFYPRPTKFAKVYGFLWKKYWLKYGAQTKIWNNPSDWTHYSKGPYSNKPTYFCSQYAMHCPFDRKLSIRMGVYGIRLNKWSVKLHVIKLPAYKLLPTFTLHWINSGYRSLNGWVRPFVKKSVVKFVAIIFEITFIMNVLNAKNHFISFQCVWNCFDKSKTINVVLIIYIYFQCLASKTSISVVSWFVGLFNDSYSCINFTK